MSPEYKNALLEAAYRVGFDGNGLGGIVGYFMWIAACYPKAYIVFLTRLLLLEHSHGANTGRALPTLDEINEGLRKDLGLSRSKTGKERRLTSKPELLDELISIADKQPEWFCKTIVALLPRPRAQQRLGART